MKQSFETLSPENLAKLIQSKNYVQDATIYSTEEYLDALSYIQQYTYKDPRIVWGTRWRQKLASSIPFIIKLLYKGYNNFLVFPISTRKTSWVVYPEAEEDKYLMSAGINLIVKEGVAYQNSSRHTIIIPTFRTDDNPLPMDNGMSIHRYISNLVEIGAMAMVKNGYYNKATSYQYSAKYIISKDKLRELVNLFLSTFTSIYNTSLTYSSSLSSLSSLSSSLSNTYIFPSYSNSNYAKISKMCQNDTVEDMINWNNSILPEEEQMTYKGRRIYADVCSYVNEEKHEKIIPGTMTKQKYCDKVFGQNNWFEFDRKGSIYNLTYSLNKKEYLDNNIDIYEKINNIKFTSKEERDLYKLTQMSIYFSTYKRTINFIYRYMQIKYENGIIPENKQKLINAYWKLVTKGKAMEWSEFAAGLHEHFDARKKAMKKFIGDNKAYIDKGSKYSENFEKNIDSFIFMKESEIYLEFVTMLRKQSLRVVQIYDGFYLEKGSISEKELNEMLKNIILNASIDK